MIKSIFRSSFVQLMLGVMIRIYMSLISSTAKWTVEGEEHIRPLWESDKGALLAAWHSRILLLPVIPLKLAKKWAKPPVKTAMIISMSRDGAFVAKASELLGLNPIRGSASNKKKKDKDKGGIEAVREAARTLKNGATVCMTPDGPRGPRETVGLGIIKIAQLTGAPIVVWGVSAGPAKRMKTWDKFVLPGLFAKGAVVFGEPIVIGRKETAEDASLKLQTALRDATRRADELAGLNVLPYPEPPERPEPDRATISAAS